MRKFIFLFLMVSVVFAGNGYGNGGGNGNGNGSGRNVTPVIDYRMDECNWDNNISTYEIKNYGSLGSEYNATALNNADVTDGKICNGGDLNATYSDDKAVLAKTGYVLPDEYTINLWIKFPLNIEGHKKFEESEIDDSWLSWFLDWFGLNSDDIDYIYYFNIADRVGSDNDYIYFAYDETNIQWYLCVADDSDYDCQIFDVNSYSGWHMLTFVVSNETDFYLDGQYYTTFDTAPTGTLGLLFNSDYGSETNNQPNGQSIGATVDEFEIYDKALKDRKIEKIYKNENSGKNYNGSLRVCPVCNNINQTNYRFDAWDDNKNINERILTTKLINRNFTVMLASLDENGNDYQEFNGTVCSRIVGDGYEGAWNKTVWNNEKEKNVTFNVDMALKSARVNIHWINDNLSADCPLQNETNESNSTDNFAVRPAYYKIDGVNKNLKAGADFSVLIKAYDANNQFIKDFNFSNAPVELDFNDSVGCKTGELNSTSSPLKTSADFVNGEANVTLNYTEVGDLNISVKEYNNSSEFAGVDEKQEDNTILLIGEGNSTVKHFNPYKFEINATYENYKDGNFTYYDGDLNITSHMDLNITAKNKENKTTENYNKECYAKDIDINLSHNSVDVDVNKILYKYKDASGNMHGIFSVDKDNDVNITYSKDNFTTDHNGTARIDVYLNFDRNISNPVNPFEFEITSIDVNDSDANGSLDLNKKVKYYYGSLMLDDILAVKNDFNKTYSFVVYDDNDSDTLKPDSKESAYDWYENIYHRKIDGNVSNDEIVVSSDYNASNSISDVNVSVSQDDNGQHITFKINRKPGSSVNFAVVHLLSSNLKWLWYSKFGDEYNISKNDSTCLNHFCFTVTWQNTNDVGEVGSGSFTGTEANVTESNSTKRGVKIFR